MLCRLVFNNVVCNGSVVIKEVFLCAFVCVGECRVHLSLIQLSLSRCQDGKITVSGCFTYISWDFSIEQQAFALAALLAKNTNSRLCGRQTFPSWCLLCFVCLRSLQASGCSFMLLCLRNHVTMYLSHTFFISTLQFICTNASRGN